MKKTSLFIFCLFQQIYGYGQKAVESALGVGDYVPKIQLNKVMDYQGRLFDNFEGKSMLSDFGGKIVILDFWTTYCSSCIAGFPEMSELQEKFKGKIQIFLVNYLESDEVIKKKLGAMRAKGNGISIIPSNLPILADAKHIQRLFPAKGEIGYHVWVDKFGKVVLRGISENTHENKITQFLETGKINFIEDNALAFNGTLSYFKWPQARMSEHSYLSKFGSFDDKSASAYGGGSRNVIDSTYNTKRNTYLNCSIEELYAIAIKDRLDSDKDILYGNQIMLLVEDSAKVSQNEKTLNRRITDEDIRNSLCYEQIVPINMSDEKRFEMMLNDLNKYLKTKFKITGNWEKRSTPCLKIKFVGDTSSLLSHNYNPEIRSKITKENYFYEYKGYDINELFKHYFQKMSGSKIRPPKVIFSDFKVNMKVDLNLRSPSRFKSFEEMRSALNAVGFSIEEGSAVIDVFVIKDKQ